MPPGQAFNRRAKPPKRPAARPGYGAGYGIKISKPKTPQYGGGFGATPQAAHRAPIPAAPPPPAPAYQPQQLGFDPVYENTRAQAGLGYDQTLAANQYQRGRIRQTYGFDDVSDPFNRAAMLKKNYMERQQGTTNSYAAQGQLYSGATQRGLDEGRSSYDQSYAGLRRQYEDELQGLAQSDLAAQIARDMGVNEALADSIGRQGPPEDPGVPPAYGPAKKGGGSFTQGKPKRAPAVKGPDLRFGLPPKKAKPKKKGRR